MCNANSIAREKRCFIVLKSEASPVTRRMQATHFAFTVLVHKLIGARLRCVLPECPVQGYQSFLTNLLFQSWNTEHNSWFLLDSLSVAQVAKKLLSFVEHKLHRQVQRSPPLVPELSQNNAVHTPTRSQSFNITVSSVYSSYKRSFLPEYKPNFVFLSSDLRCVCTCVSVCVCVRENERIHVACDT